jgi:hypothetical protein
LGKRKNEISKVFENYILRKNFFREEQKIKLSETKDTDEFVMILQITLQSRQVVMMPAGF